MSRKQVQMHLVCGRCQCGFSRAVWNPTQAPKYCSDACRMEAIGRTFNPGSVPEQRERNRRFVAEVNARTVCAHCGAQPIEWHNPEHVELGRQAYRISRLIQSPRSIAVIRSEIARCTPLCRRCHMAEDGRLRAFLKMASAPKPKADPRPCVECGRLAKPLRRGLCNACSSRHRYYRKTETGEHLGAVQRRTYSESRRLAS